MTPSSKSSRLPQAELDEILKMRPQMRLLEIDPATPLPEQAYDRVLMANRWSELPDPVALLHAVRERLCEDGRLILVEWHHDADSADAPETRVPLQEMVHLLEHNGWDIHRHGNLGPHCYFLEAGVSDESVQS
jgi:hypothetical protein